jgi:hypothetical protein
MLIVVTCSAVIAAWIARGMRQRRAVIAFDKLDEHGCTFHSFVGEGPCAGVIGPKYEPFWLARKIGIDFFYDVTMVFVDAEELDEALPHLRCLPGLREIYVSTVQGDDSDSDREAAAERIEEAIGRLRREFPHLKIEEHPACPITVSRIPVVG